jgi:hypothetical protein
MAIEYTEFEAQVRAIRDQLVATATAEADEWLTETLAMMRRLPGKHGENTSVPVRHQTQHAVVPIKEYKMETRVTLTTVTRDAIESLGSRDFDSAEVRRMIESKWKPMDGPTQRANLANLLKRMVNRGELELVEKGTGAKPSKYRRKATEAVTQEQS